MKVEPNRSIHTENPRPPAYDIVLRCKNSLLEADDKDSEENKGDGKSRAGGQLEKQAKCDRSKSESEEEKENNLELVNLLTELKQKCRISEEAFSDVISRSPMRTQECHHYYKPYEYPHSTSRTFGGVTRVVEKDRRGSYPAGEPPSDSVHAPDVDLCDVSQWLSLCKRDPKFLQQFLMDCKNEVGAREISKINECRCSRNECSNVSSQLTSPVQSPAEQNLTSPESVSYEDSSLYSTSPNIPTLDWVNIKPAEDDGRRRSPSTNGKISLELNCGHANVPEGPGDSDPVRPPDFGAATSSNIGTVMLKLAEDPYESTIDLNQFATVCDTHDLPPASPTAERDALNDRLDPRAKENAWTRISQVNLDLLGKGDKDGDTQLMILLVSETEKILEYVYVIVERLLKENPAYLSLRNELNQDALYLAAFKLVWEPLVASYIAEALVRGKQDVCMKYDDGNTLLHCLAKQGDTHWKVLERLLKLRHSNKTPVFDVNKKNNRGFTPLHIACEAHRREVVHAYQTAKVLVENGADCTAKDYKDENTPIHVLLNESCDVELLRVILETSRKSDAHSQPTVVPNRQGNTALHLACGRNTLRLSHQKEIIGLLLRHGAMIQLKNINGCVPSVLVDSSRKQEIRTILHSCRQKF